MCASALGNKVDLRMLYNQSLPDNIRHLPYVFLVAPPQTHATCHVRLGLGALGRRERRQRGPRVHGLARLPHHGRRRRRRQLRLWGGPRLLGHQADLGQR